MTKKKSSRYSNSRSRNATDLGTSRHRIASWATSIALVGVIAISYLSYSGPPRVSTLSAKHAPQGSQLARVDTPGEIQAQTPSVTVGPESVKGDNWKYIINNAVRSADKYATEKNPKAVFVGSNVQTDFIEQFAGTYKGRHLLKLVNTHNGNTSFAMLLPLFDEYSSSTNLDDTENLWKVTSAKYNGRSF